MTAQTLVATCHRAGILLAVTDDAHLRVEAPRGVLTPELRAALLEQKPTLLTVLTRLERMRATAGQAPIVVVDPAVGGGPGHCFSCGAEHPEPAAYGRCTPCAIAADIFYAAQDAAVGNEVVA